MRICHRGRKMEERIANFVYDRLDSQEKSLMDFCVEHGILPSAMIAQVCMHRLTQNLKHAICRELGFDSWDELKAAALSAVDA